jgi:hypothetical protein
MRVHITETQLDGGSALKLETEALRMLVVPGRGAKIRSLVDKRTGHEYLWSNPQPPDRRPMYGDYYPDCDTSGWDECFPTISEVFYPEPPWTGILVPDHGEVWALPWSWESQGDILRLWVHGVRFPYRFERSMDFSDPDRVVVTYVVQNFAPFEFKCFWSMHPTFNVTPATRILLPPQSRVRVELSTDDRLGLFLAEHAWPMTVDRLGQEVDMSLMGSIDQGFGDKLFTTPLSEGWAAFTDPSTQQYLAFTFCRHEVPHVGICANRGAWSAGGKPYFALMLEPCNGWPDRLDLAMTRGRHITVPALGQWSWSVALHIGRGDEQLAGIIRHRA